LQTEKLFKDRVTSSCALIKDKDGSPVVAIIGGYDKGMELWNPQTRKVQLLWNEILPEVGEPGGFSRAQALPINDGSELILYGALTYPGSDASFYKDDIWKYTVKTNIWTKYYKSCLPIFYKVLKVFLFLGLEAFCPKDMVM